MLGWFKKKFKKQDQATPKETAPQEIVEHPEVTQGPVAEVHEETVPEKVSSPDSPGEEVAAEHESAPAEPAIEETETEQSTEESEDTATEPLQATEEIQEDSELPVEEPVPTISEMAQPDQPVEEPEEIPEPSLEPEATSEPEEISPETNVADIIPAEESIEEPSFPPEPETPHPAEAVESSSSIEEDSERDEALSQSSARIEPPKYQQPAQKPGTSHHTFESGAKTTQQKSGLFSRLSKRLTKTRESFTYQMDALFLGKKEIDTALLDDLEEILILADLGVGTTQDLLEHARRKVKRKELKDPAALRELLKEKISEFIVANDQDAALVMPEEGPFVIMVIGVNGVGKTTTIGKIAKKFINSGSSVMLVAADTFRAAAIAQLQIWGDRNNVPVIAHKEGSDPSSVVFDGLGAAIDQKVDVVLVDTAGRLHTKANLMEELKKIKRVMSKRLPGAPHETLLVIDATTGQNGISQAKLFNEAVEVTGLALTKLDGTSKGGIVANICKDLKIPIRFIGIGEQVDDLRDFESSEFVDALFQSRSQSE